MKFSNSRELIKNFLSTTIENEKTDYLKRENSNFIFSNSLLRHQIDNWAEEDYLFSEILNPELIESSKEGYVYIHDKKLQNYCVSVSAKQIAEIGMPSLAKNMLESDSAKNFITLFRHFSNVITFLSQQVSGAIMINNIMTISASYLFIEEVIKGRKYENWLIKQTLQNFIWELNEPLRSGSQTPFSNVTMEFEVDSNLKDQYIIFGGKPVKYKYQDIPQEYLDNINSIFLDVMASGSSKNTPFTFPLITVPYTGDKIRRNPIYLKLLSEMKKWGGCYFENFLPDAFKEGSYYRKLNVNLAPKDPEISRSMCCRLNIPIKELQKLGAGIFGSTVGNTGAVQVLNLNLNRLLMEFVPDDFKDRYEELQAHILENGVEGTVNSSARNYFDEYLLTPLYKKMDYLLEVMQKGHMEKRKWLEEYKTLFPNFFAYNTDLKNYFNVFSIIGVHEGLINIGIPDGIKHPVGKVISHLILQKITKKIGEFTERDQVACGIEYAPKLVGVK